MQNYISASSSSSFVSNNIKVSQGKKLTGILYTIIKLLAEQRFCKYSDARKVEEKVQNSFSIQEINSYLNFFNSKTWKDSNFYNRNWKDGIYWPEVSINFVSGEVQVAEPLMPAKLIEFIEGCVNTKKCNLVEVFSLIIQQCYIAAGKEELERVIKKKFMTQDIKDFKSYDLKTEVVGSIDKFYDMYHDDMEVTEAIYDYYRVNIKKDKDKLLDETMIILFEEVYQTYVSGYWIFKPERW